METSERSHYAGPLIIFLAIVSYPAPACAGGLEGEAGLGIGITVLGGRRRTGGVTLLPSGSIGWRFADWGSLRYRNALPIFNWSAIRLLGVIDMNTVLLGLHFDPVRIELGPSLDVFAVPLCADSGCRREHGLSPGGHVGAVLLPTPSSKLIASTTAHLTYIRGITWSGISFSAALEARYRW